MSFLSNLKKRLPEAGRSNAIPAAMIDRTYLSQPTTLIGRIWRFTKIRALYTFLFLPLAVVDLLVSGLLGASYALRSFFTADDRQAARLAKQQKYATIFSKNLSALAAFIFGFISPKLVTFYFTPEKINPEGVSAGGSYYHDQDAELVQPENVDELANIIKAAKAANHKIMPMGAGRSQGKQFLPEGGEKAIVIDLIKFNTIQVNAVDKTAIVGAGARWIDLQLDANRHKLALKVMQASNVFSVGGSIGTNIHGWDHITGVLSNTILSMDIIDVEGNFRTITPDDPLFHHITGGLGLYGVVVSAKIQLTDNELLTEKGVDIAPKDYVKYFREQVQTNDNTRMHLYRLSLDPKNLLGSGVAVSYDKEGDEAPVVTPNLRAEGNRGTRYDQIMINMARNFDLIRKKYWEGERDRALANNHPPVTTNEIMQPPINAMFNPSVSESEWLQEYFIPDEQLDGFLEQLGQLLMDNHVPLLNASVRFVKQHDKSPLSYTHDGDRFAVVLCFNQSLKESNLIQAKKWLRESQKLAIEHGGAYYLPYQHVSSPDDFQAAYPHAAEAQVIKDQIDPEHVFTSGFHQKYMAPQPDKINHFKAIVATPESKKEFSGFLKNVLQRVDSDQFYALLEDVMEYNDSHAEIYQELCRRLPEIMPSRFKDFRHILQSLSAIKSDLADQAYSLLPNETRTINGLVEIGYPGRFVNGFKQHYKVNSPIVAVHEQQSVTDYIQTGFPRPYDQFETLDYNKPNLSGLADNSADVITCYVGLHHFSEEELENFLKDIRRVLREGGHFLLVDHDVVDDQSMSMAHMAHTIFNAVTGASLEEEMNERRNFQPISYWKELLAKHDLGYAVEGPDVPMIRSGDPSRNRMVSFVKAAPQLSVSHEQDFEEPKLDDPSPSVREVPKLGDWRKNPRNITVSYSSQGIFGEGSGQGSTLPELKHTDIEEVTLTS